MNVPTITMDPAEAQARLDEYRASLVRSADAEYEAAVAGYEALAEGTPVVQYGPAIAAAPVDEKGRPMLAIARADRRQVEFEWFGTSRSARFNTAKVSRWALPAGSLLDLWTPMGRLHGLEDRHGYRQTVRGYALVPMVPPHALKAAGGRSRLRDHVILWEVEEWADQPIQALPDRDPLLLRPIHGDLCAVVAQWDLTDLERAVMAGRRDG